MKKNNIIVFILITILSILPFNTVKANSKTYEIKRIYGEDRFETSINIGKEFGKVNNVIIANGYNFPDALSGSNISKKYNAPILLVGNSVEESGKTLSYLENYLDKNGTIYILGGNAAVKEEFIYAFKNRGYKNIIRLGGKDRFSTNKEIIENTNTAKNTPVVLVNGYNFPDALSISSIAAEKGYPIIITPAGKLSKEGIEIIKKIEPEKVYLIGGEAVVKNSLKDSIKSIIPSIKEEDFIRIGGVDRYETSLNICKTFNFKSEDFILASGKNFPDALSGSALACNLKAPIILTDGESINIQKKYLDEENYKRANILGGQASVSIYVERSLKYEREFTKYEIKEKNNNSVVDIQVFDKEGKPLAEGSGFIVSEEGKVVTNFHVINQGYFAKVTMENGEKYNVQGVCGYSREKDIAVLKIEGDNFTKVNLGNSKDIQLSDRVIAIGNPGGYKNVVTEGIVKGIKESALREGKDIESTAFIKPGSSGGALFNEYNEVIGITYAGYEALKGGFSIPIDDVKYIIEKNNLISLSKFNEEVQLSYDKFANYLKSKYKGYNLNGIFVPIDSYNITESQDGESILIIMNIYGNENKEKFLKSLLPEGTNTSPKMYINNKKFIENWVNNIYKEVKNKYKNKDILGSIYCCFTLNNYPSFNYYKVEYDYINGKWNVSDWILMFYNNEEDKYEVKWDPYNN